MSNENKADTLFLNEEAMKTLKELYEEWRKKSEQPRTDGLRQPERWCHCQCRCCCRCYHPPYTFWC